MNAASPYGLRFRLLALMVAASMVVAGSACSPRAHGTPVDNPDLEALLRPGEPISRERLLQAGDEVFYEAELRARPPGNYRDQYLAELDERGFSIWPGTTSSHSFIHRIEGWNVRVVQEAALKPYTIRYRTTWNGNGPERNIGKLLLHGWSFPHPVSVSGNRVSVRLSSDFLKPWTTRVVVPERSLVSPPDDFPLPLPPTGVLVDSDDGRGAGRPSIYLNVICRTPPSQVISFYRQQLAGVSHDKSATAEIGSFPFTGARPPWVPQRAVLFFVEAWTSLFAAPSIAVNDARHLLLRPPGAFDNGAYHPAALTHVPMDAYSYLIKLDLS